jgi:hypothetical protein
MDTSNLVEYNNSMKDRMLGAAAHRYSQKVWHSSHESFAVQMLFIKTITALRPNRKCCWYGTNYYLLLVQELYLEAGPVTQSRKGTLEF